MTHSEFIRKSEELQQERLEANTVGIRLPWLKPFSFLFKSGEKTFIPPPPQVVATFT